MHKEKNFGLWSTHGKKRLRKRSFRSIAKEVTSYHDKKWTIAMSGTTTFSPERPKRSIMDHLPCPFYPHFDVTGQRNLS